MPLTPEQQQELQELRRLNELEQKFGNKQAAPNLLQAGIEKLIPGMAEKRQAIEEYRKSPQFKKDMPDYREPVSGLEDPAYSNGVGLVGPDSALTLVKSLGNAGRAVLGKAGDVAEGLRGMARPAAERMELQQVMKNPAGVPPKPGLVERRVDALLSAPGEERQLPPAPPTLSQYLEGKVNQARESFNKTQIAPRMAEQLQRADEQMVPLSTSELSKIEHPSAQDVINEARNAYSNQAAKEAAVPRLSTSSQAPGQLEMPIPGNSEEQTTMGLTDGMNAPKATTGEQPQTPDVLNFPMKDAIRLRQMANEVTPNFMKPNVKTDALNIGNYVRKSIGDVDPRVGELSDEMKYLYQNVDKPVFGSPKNPRDVRNVLFPASGSKAGLKQAEDLGEFDKLSGSPVKLQKISNDIGTLQDRAKATSWNGLRRLTTLNAGKESLDLLKAGAGALKDKAAQSLYTGLQPKDADNATSLWYLLRGAGSNAGDGNK